MVTRLNIADCYQKYRENMEREEYLKENSMQASDQEVWMESRRQNARFLRRFYVENEALFNLYIRPFLTGELKLTDSLAAEFFKQIWDYHCAGYDDELMCVDVAYLLEAYFSQHNNKEGILWISHYLGGVLNTYDTEECYKKSLEYFDVVRNGIKDYFSIEDWELRRSILFSFYNYPVVMVNCRKVAADGESWEVQKRLRQEIARAIAVYDDPEVRALDGGKYDLDGLKDELIHDVYGNWVCGMEGKERIEGEFALEADKALTELYQQALLKNPDPYAMEDTIYCNYWKCQYVCGKISLTEFLEKYMGYCIYIREHQSLDTEDFINSSYYHVCMYDIPNVLDQAEELPPEEKSRLQTYCFEAFRNFVKELPKVSSNSYLNVSLIDTLCQILPYLPQELFDFRFLMDITVNRAPAIMIHSVIVQQLAGVWTRAILDTTPELFIGVFETENVLDVLDKRGKIENFVREAALIHDIGKIGITNVVSSQIRRLNKREWKRIYQHPVIGCRIADKALCLRQYHDVILGHHKSYDGKSGYPTEYDNTKSPVRILTDMLYICDCMEAATDDIERSYKRTKTMDELVGELLAGKGQLYNPQLVDFLTKTPELLEKLRYICNAGRNKIHYEVYSDFISPKAKDQEEKEQDILMGDQSDILDIMQERDYEKEQILMSLAKASMAIFLIYLRTDRVKLLYRGKNDWFADEYLDSFRGFIGEYLRGKMADESWQKLKTLLSYRTLTEKLAEGEGIYEIEVQLNSGTMSRWVRMQFFLAEEEYCVPVSVILSIQDIDEVYRKREQMQTALELAYQQTREANEAKSRFLSSMSHDIRTPMNAIIGMTQIAAMHLGDWEKVEDCLGKIRSASNHLLELINQVLDMSRIESGRIELEDKPVNLRKIIGDMITMTHSEAQKKHIHVQMELEELWQDEVYGDASRIQQIFLNLMSNAIKYTPEKGSVRFYAKALPEKDGAYVTYQFQFQDTGIGMSPEFQKKVFEPFAREKTEQTANIQGTGLGLSITKTLANLMRGDVIVESTLGKGSCFTVTLRLREVESRIPEEEVHKENWTMEEGLFRGYRVLITEDNEINREIIRELLAPTEITIEEAVDGKEAVECVACHPDRYYHMILMDIQMPVMNGYEAAAAIRSLEKERGGHIPIIALTANAFSQDIDMALASGMDGYLSKPVDIKKVVAALRRWVLEAVPVWERFEFRSIRQDEGEQAAGIEKICFPPNEACSRQMMLKRVAKAPELFLVAVDKRTGKIAGFLNGLSTDESVFRDEFFTDVNLYDPKGKNIMLLGLDVLPEYRRQGLATELMAQYVRREKERGRQALLLTCLPPKVKMYEKMGFFDKGIANSSWGGEQWHEMSYVIGR